MSQSSDINLPNQTVIETRWLTMVNEIQQQHNVLIELIEKLEQNPATNQVTVLRLTHLQQHVLDTLSKLLAESLTEGDAVATAQFWERLQKKHDHSLVLVQLKQNIDSELEGLRIN